MTLADLIESAQALDDGGSRLHVALAAVASNANDSNEGEVTLADVGDLLSDPSAEEIDVVPTRFVETDPVRMTIADIRSRIELDPQLENYTLAAVTRMKRLADGGTAQLTVPLVGTYIPPSNDEIWLLQSPIEQWPKQWFE